MIKHHIISDNFACESTNASFAQQKCTRHDIETHDMKKGGKLYRMTASEMNMMDMEIWPVSLVK